MILNVIIFNMSWLYCYYRANIHPMIIFNFFSWAYWPNFVDNNGFFFPLSKGATTSVKPIYKHCG